MRKYVYENATVYITEPTDAQVENIRKSTERFVTMLAKKGLIKNEHTRRSCRRTSESNTNAGR